MAQRKSKGSVEECFKSNLEGRLNGRETIGFSRIYTTNAEIWENVQHIASI